MANILLMEDDVEFSFVLQRDLREAGHEVDIRFTASDAIDVLKHASYDLVITDMIVFEGTRPVPDGGISLLSWIRHTTRTSETPIIAITGSHKNPGMADILGLARSVGADDALEKPFAVQDLLAKIERLLADQMPTQSDDQN